MNLPLEIALIGTVFYLFVFAGLTLYAATHYTRVPGGRWSTWEKARPSDQWAAIDPTEEQAA